MLTGMHLGNFKAFAETQHIPVRPLTLIFGANSAGKSSLIHSLLLAQHAEKEGNAGKQSYLDMHRTELGGDSVDLGGFLQYVHGRNFAHRTVWGMDLNLGDEGLTPYLPDVARASLTLTIGVRAREDNLGVPHPDGNPEILSCQIDVDGAPFAAMRQRTTHIMQVDRIEVAHPAFIRLMDALIEAATTTPGLRDTDRAAVNSAVDMLVPELSVRSSTFLPGALLVSGESVASLGAAGLLTISRGNRNDEIENAVRLLLPRALDEILHALHLAAVEQFDRFRYLGPLRSYPPRHLAFSQNHDPNWRAGGGYAWDVVRNDARVRSLINDWLGSPARLQTQYELVVRQLAALEDLATPLYNQLAEWYDETATVEQSLAQEIASSPNPQEAYSEVVESSAGDEPVYPAQILGKYLDQPDKVKQMLTAFPIEHIPDLALLDKRTQTLVSHRDVGIGISQVLPVLVSAYAERGKLIAIEQPEIHLHPALQAELADVFIESALGPRKNTFLLETHSEHLILRVMRRLRNTANGSLPDHIPPIRPEDVAILFVQPNGKRTAAIVTEIHLDEEGEMLDNWPGGFFEEGFRERFSDGE